MSQQDVPDRGPSGGRSPAIWWVIVAAISALVALIVGLGRRIRGKSPQVIQFRNTPLTVVVPYQGKSVKVTERPIPPFETLKSPQDEFTPEDPPFINFEVVDARHSDVAVTEFDPPLILEIEFSELQVKAAQQAAQDGKLTHLEQQLPMPLWGFWDGTHWVVFKKKHNLEYVPNGKTGSGVISTVKLTRWADPPLGVWPRG
jgi:hypothetical protein